MEPGTAFARLDRQGEDRFQRLRAELGLESFGLNLMRLRPGQRGRVHAHERQEEAYLVLEGTLTLILPDGERALGPDELARVAPDVRRQLVNRGDELCLVLALGGATPHEGRDAIAWEGGFDAPDEEARSPGDVPLPPDLAR